MLINRDLNPQLIYRLNRILYDILENKKTDNLLILPGVFDRYSRKFNWVGVHKNRWDDFNKEELKKEIINYIEDNPDDWKNFLKNLDKKFIEETSTSLAVLRNLEKEDFYFHFLNLYSSYPIDSDKFIDGIIYNQLNKQFKSATGTLQYIKSVGLPLINITLNDIGDEYKTINQWTLEKNEPGKNEEDIATNWTRNNRFYLGIFKVIFYCMNPAELKEDEFPFIDFIVFPIYDFYDKGKYYGNYYGNLTIFYKKEDYGKKEDDKKQKDIETILSPYRYLLATELEKAAIHKILEQEIEKNTILEHFIEHLPILQDWECIMVQSIENTKIEYCYKRNTNKWSQCKPSNNCQTCPHSQDKEDLPKKLKIDLKEIFNHDLIPELDESDIKHCKNLKLICEYPSYTKFPDDKKKIEYFYKRQQLDLLRQLALQQKMIKETVKHGTRTAIAAIMSREDSHNIGSHVLASLNQDVIRNRPFDVEKLMNYIQQRWDFIAGIVPGYPSWSEPLFFFSDILKGFFEQGLLLDYLIKDDGVGGNIIKFHIKYNTHSITFAKKLFVRLVKNGQREDVEVELNVEDIKGLKSYDETAIKEIIKTKGKDGEINEIEVKFMPELPNDIEDILVDIPGGVVGCHAFYCILENIMRNAAKYSYKEEPSKCFEIFINVEDDSKDSNLFSITISDNCSKENRDFKIAGIQGKLKGDLVDRKGEIVSKDWGIQVIKLGTKYLRSPCDEDTITVNAIPEEKEYSKYLAYKFEIRKPRLVTVADFNACVPEKEQTKGIKIKHVKDNNDLESLIKDFFSQLLIVLPKKDENDIKEILNFLANSNSKFPARILLCGNNKKHTEQIKKVLCTLEKDGTITKRRFFVGEWWEPSFQKEWEEQFIIQAYKEWVWSFGEIKDIINIAVYFDRTEEHKCFDRWKNLNDETLKIFELENSIKLSIYGKGKNGNDIVIKVAGEECDKNAKNIILFDNHGKLGLKNVTVDDGKGLKTEQKRKNVCLHYHSIGSDSRSGFNNRCIFDTLANVSSSFSGVFALLLLMESAITKVLVIDERVVKSLVQNISLKLESKEKYIQPNNRLDSLQASGCFVPFFLRWHGRSKCLIKEYNEEIQNIALDKGKEEGLWFDSNGLKIKILKDKSIKQIPEVDFVVIHRGIFETFLKEVNIDMNAFTNLCKNISPRLIITSGRGNTDSKNKEKEMNNLPFFEYSVLQRFIIQEFSKYQICRILFSVR